MKLMEKNINKQIVICPNTLPTKDPNQILSLFSEILREYNVLKTQNENCLSSLKDSQICVDVNNNETEEVKEEHYCNLEDDNNNTCDNNHERFKANLKNPKSVDFGEKMKCEVEKDVEPERSCICDGRCPNSFYRQINGRHVCCCTEDSVDNVDRVQNIENLNCEPCSKPARPLENVVVDINASIRKTFDTMYLSRKRISSENENSSTTEKRIHHERKRGSWCEEFPCEEPAFREVVQKYAEGHSDRSNVGKSSNEDLIFVRNNHQKPAGEPVTESVKKKEVYECDENCTSKLEHHSMLVTKDQGLMEVHIVSLQLSKTAARFLFQDSVFWNASFFISWNIRGQKTSFTPVLKYPKLNFDSSSIFVVSELFNFLDYIFEEYITFQVHVFYPNETTHTIAQTKLCVKEVLDYPHNKMQYISPVNSTIPCSSEANFGQLSLWVRLSCDLDKIKTFKTQRGIVSEDIFQKPATRIKKRSKDERDSLYSSNGSTGLAKKKKEQESREEDLLPVFHKEDKLLEKEDSGELKIISDKIDFERKELYMEDIANVESIDNIKPVDIAKKPQRERKITGDSCFKLSPKNSKNIGSRSPSEITENESTSDEKVHLKMPVDIRELDTKPKERKGKIRRDSSDQVETEDIVEFNKMLSNSYEAQVDSDSTLHDVKEVLMDDSWDKYKTKDLQTMFEQKAVDKTEEDDFVDVGSYPLVEKDKEPDRIVIKLNSIQLYEGTYIFLDPNIIQLYIEYSFLGYAGEEMETSSEPMPELLMSGKVHEISYNFKKEFQIDEETHSKQRKILQDMLNGIIDPNIKFIIVSEPLLEEKDKECVEIGFALLNLKNYVTGVYPQDMALTIVDNEENKMSLGILRITVGGLEAMKSCL